MKLIAAIAAIALTGALPHQSNVVLSGRVMDAVSRQPMAGAQVAVANSRLGSITDANGDYRIALPAEYRGRRITLTAQHIGYRTVSKTLEVKHDTTVTDFALSQSPLDIAALQIGESRPLVARAAGAARPHWNTESYSLIRENGFRSARAEPLSTFSIDVDRASYSNIRRFVRTGKLPPKDAVRIEEMINYFPYAYAQPRGSEPFSVTTETGAAPWQPQHSLVRIGLQARRVDLADLPANNLVFLVDVSGSMQPENKLPLLKQSLRLLVNELRLIDRVAIVVYAGSAGLVLPSTSGADKSKILDALEALDAGGSTAGGAGIRLAYQVAQENHIARGNNRVILATDGDFNVGVSSDAEMIRLVEEKREQGTFLTVLGFGMGNLKDSKLEQIADHGNGNYAYIDDLLEARKVLVTELGGTLLTVAKDVKIQVEFNPARVSAYRLIGYENRLLENQDFDNDKKDAGEMGAGHSVTALYEVVPAGVTTIDAKENALRYQRPRTSNSSAMGNEMLFAKVRYKEPERSTSKLLQQAVLDGQSDLSADFRFAASVAAFGMLLRGSEHRGAADFEMVLQLAQTALGDDIGAYRHEFVRLVEAAREMQPVVAD